MLFSLLILPLSRSTLFPYTTLFRSLANFQDLAGMVDPAPGELADMHQAVGAAQVDKRAEVGKVAHRPLANLDRKSTRLNSSHPSISYAVFCLKKKKNNTDER